MAINQQMLVPYESQLKSPSARERDSAAGQLSDFLEYGDLTLESRLTVGNWLIDSLWNESDGGVIEAILHALGWVNWNGPCPQLPWHRLGEFLPKLQSPLLGEYGLAMLGECGDPTVIPILEPYLQHPEAIVREEASKAIGSLKKIRQE